MCYVYPLKDNEGVHFQGPADMSAKNASLFYSCDPYTAV